ncbi:type II secretion system protein GspC [Litoribacillus peritrichatus]|uniref:Type II secretion system protein GspC N-terminal domain-containing protein n=1 Tax=Litoribacillus peritrichatus TaxID=718191 RepID=A0ABP7MWD8_9GAMM
MISNLTPEKLLTITKTAKVVVTLLLCVWLSNIAAKAVWLVVAPEPIPEIVASAGSSTGLDAKRSMVSRSVSIASEILFGEAPKVTEVAQTEVVDAPKTRLRLRLLGVFVGQKTTLSTAIISEQGKSDAEFYHVGDTVQNGVRLDQVLADRVILNRNGRLEALYFDDDKDLFEVQEKAEPDVAQQQEEINTVDQFAAAAQKQWQANPLSALGAVGFEPVSKDGQALGYRFSGHNPAMERYGIQKGDVILSVNGIDVGDTSSDGEYLDQVFEQGEASVVVERGSRQFEITVPLK